MEKTNIIWTEKTWNPVTGCQQISEGCRFCYAKTIAENYGGKAWPNLFDLTYREHKLNDPFKWKEPSIVFVNSMSDLFWDKISIEYVNKIIDVIEATPQHEYQVLTKRPEEMLSFSKKRKLPPNFWAGVTIENERNLYRLNILKEIKANIKFISFEPLIGYIGEGYDLNGIDWAITGGESGVHMYKKDLQENRGLVYYDSGLKKFLPENKKIEWVRSILNKCRQSNTAFFHKQWGGNYPEAAGRVLDGETYNEMPKFAGMKNEINNEYLKKLELKKTVIKQ